MLIVVADEAGKVGFNASHRLREEFVGEIPCVQVFTCTLARFGLQRRRGDRENILADFLDPVLPPLIVTEGLPMERHRIDDRAGKTSTRAFHVR